MRSRLASVLNFDFGLIFDEVENFNYYQRLPFDNENELESYDYQMHLKANTLI